MIRTSTRGRSRTAIALFIALSTAVLGCARASAAGVMAWLDFTSPQGFKASMPPRWLARIENDAIVVEHEEGTRVVARLMSADATQDARTDWKWHAVGASSAGLAVATRTLPEQRRAVALRISPPAAKDFAILEFETGADGRDRELIDAQRILRTLVTDRSSSAPTIRYSYFDEKDAVRYGRGSYWSDPSGNMGFVLPTNWEITHGGMGYDAKRRQTGLYAFVASKDGRANFWFGDPRITSLYRLPPREGDEPALLRATAADEPEMPYETGAQFLYRYVPQAVADRCNDVRNLRTIERPDIARLLGVNTRWNRSPDAPLPSTFEVHFSCSAAADGPDRTPWVGSALAATERLDPLPAATPGDGAPLLKTGYWNVRLVQGWIARAPDADATAFMQAQTGGTISFFPRWMCERQPTDACFANLERASAQSRAIAKAAYANVGRVWGSGRPVDAAFAPRLERLISLVPETDVTELVARARNP